MFPNLFSSIKIRNHEIKNRILFTGHDTTLPTDGTINDALIAYHKSRVDGGVGLIVTQVAGIHETARYTTHILMASDDNCIDGYRNLTDMCHKGGTVVFAQLFHPGREIMESQNGTIPVAYSASATPSERFHVIPREMSHAMVQEMIDGYGDAAARLCAAGVDGAEIVASHGYLPAQFLNPRINKRSDEYGGELQGRLRFLEEIISNIRRKTNPDFAIGLRISGDEKNPDGLEENESLLAIKILAPKLDYVSVVAGSSATLGGGIHIVPPMAIENNYIAPFSQQVKEAVDIPVLVAGRINQPQDGEQIIAQGQADMAGMTRALICDPTMPNKAKESMVDDIRACIGCNQACIGHFHKGYPISCIQHPETGRELEFSQIVKTNTPKKIMVVGGGPAGLKAASVAAKRGHDVSLYEAAPQLGGQVKLAQLLPSRSEFGGIITNLTGEAERSGVNIHKNTSVDVDFIKASMPDHVIIATGATPYFPPCDLDGATNIVNVWDLLQGKAKTGHEVLIADWRADWIGVGIAEKLAREGCHVRLAVCAPQAGESLPLYVRDHTAGTLHKLGVETITYARLFGSDGSTIYMQHLSSDEPIIIDGIDTLVLAQGHQSNNSLAEEISKNLPDLGMSEIGDCLAPRTAEEAVYEGLITSWDL